MMQNTFDFDTLIFVFRRLNQLYVTLNVPNGLSNTLRILTHEFSRSRLNFIQLGMLYEINSLIQDKTIISDRRENTSPSSEYQSMPNKISKNMLNSF